MMMMMMMMIIARHPAPLWRFVILAPSINVIMTYLLSISVVKRRKIISSLLGHINGIWPVKACSNCLIGISAQPGGNSIEKAG